jgi:DUF4097 and DUF4098 domain-containing protein YvlB
MIPRSIGRNVLPVLGAGVLLWSALPANAAPRHFEKHFTVQGKPVVVIQNIGNGRIEVKSWRNSEVVLTGTQASDKISVDSEQAGDRIDVSSIVVDSSAQPTDMEANFQLTVPEETELQLKTQTGLIYVEQVIGDMTLESVGGDVHLKAVNGYIIVNTKSGTLICSACAGKLNFNSISGSAQILQPALSNVNIFTTSGNVLFDGEFMRTGLYTMNSGKGVVEVRFSSNDSFDLKVQTDTGSFDNQAAAFIKPDSHGLKHLAAKYTNNFVGTIGRGLAKVELSSYSGTIRLLRRD